MSYCLWWAWLGCLPTIKDTGGQAPGGRVQAQVGQVEKSPHEGPRKRSRCGEMVMPPCLFINVLRDRVPAHVLLRAKGRAKGRHLL